MKNGKIHIVAVIGSVRPGNYTSMALALTVDEIRKNGQATVEVVDPASNDFPFPGVQTTSLDAQNLRQTVSDATGIILSTPEYHGGYSSVIKLVIENLGFPSALAGKPVGLLGVAGGQIGAVKSLESLRSICAHVGAIVLPSVVSVASVERLFDETGRCLEEKTERRIRGLGHNLIEYIEKSVCPGIPQEERVRSGAQTLHK